MDIPKEVRPDGEKLRKLLSNNLGLRKALLAFYTVFYVSGEPCTFLQNIHHTCHTCSVSGFTTRFQSALSRGLTCSLLNLQYIERMACLVHSQRSKDVWCVNSRQHHRFSLYVIFCSAAKPDIIKHLTNTC